MTEPGELRQLGLPGAYALLFADRSSHLCEHVTVGQEVSLLEAGLMPGVGLQDLTIADSVAAWAEQRPERGQDAASNRSASRSSRKLMASYREKSNVMPADCHDRPRSA